MLNSTREPLSGITEVYGRIDSKKSAFKSNHGFTSGPLSISTHSQIPFFRWDIVRAVQEKVIPKYEEAKARTEKPLSTPMAAEAAADAAGFQDQRLNREAIRKEQSNKAMLTSNTADKRAQILIYGQLLTRKLARKVIDKPRPPLWMILIPVFFIFFAWKMKEYQNGIQNFANTG